MTTDPLRVPVPHRLQASPRDLPGIAWTSARAYSHGHQWPRVNLVLALAAAPLQGVVLLPPVVFGQVAHHGRRAVLVLQPTDRRKHYATVLALVGLLVLFTVGYAASMLAGSLLLTAGVPASPAIFGPLVVLLLVMAAGFSSLMHGRGAPDAPVAQARTAAVKVGHCHRLVAFVSAWPRHTGAGTALLVDVLDHLEPDVDLVLHAANDGVGAWYARYGFQERTGRVMVRPAPRH